MIKFRKLLLLITLITTLISGVFAYRVLAADTTDLTTAYNQVVDVISNQDNSTVQDPYYEASSYQAFTDSINLLGGTVGIQAVIDDALADQTTVDQYTTDINQALSGLILDDTYSMVLAEFTGADSIDLSPYTTDSKADYVTEIDRIESILNTPTAGETAIQILSQDITDANDLLILIGDKVDLITLNELLVDAYYENSELYTDSSHTAFKDACELFGSYLYVNSVIASSNVSQVEVDAIVIQIENAIDLLVLLVENTNLLTAYYILSEADLSAYTQDSREHYNSELDRIYQIIIGEELDADTAVTVLQELSTINSILLLLSDYSELQYLYDSLDVYREEDYSISSFASFTDAKQAALTTLSDLNATQDEITDAINYLEVSIEDLKLSLETIYILEEERFDIAEYITLGQATVISYVVYNDSVVDIDDQGIVEGLSYGNTTISVTLSNGAVELIDVFVTAKLSTATYILIISVPTTCLGLGALLIYGKKDSWIKLGKTITGIFKKK